MNCTACQEQLCQTLDGADAANGVDLERHLHDCGDCQAYLATIRRLETGLKQLRSPVPPAGLSHRLVAVLAEDGRRSRRRIHLRFAMGAAVAASVLIAMAARWWPGRSPVSNNVPDQVVAPRPAPPAPEVATPRESMESAVGAVASLTSRTTTETVAQTRKLLPMMEPGLSELAWQPTLPALPTLADSSHGFSEGLEPMATQAKRAVGLLRRDMLPDF